MSFAAATSYASTSRVRQLPLRELTVGLRRAALPVSQQIAAFNSVASHPKAAFNAVAHAIAMGNAVVADQGAGAFNGFDDFGYSSFGSWWNPIDWVKGIGSAIGSAFSTIGGALADAAKAVANVAVAAWNAAKDGIATLNVLTSDGRKRLFHTLVDIFLPPPIPPHYFLRRMDELIDCLLNNGHGFEKMNCVASWIVNSLKDMLNDPILWLVLGVSFNILFGNVPGAVVGGIAGVVRLLADEIKRQGTFGDKSKIVAVFLKLLSASGDLLWIWQMGSNAFANPATYLILGAMLMQGSDEVPELGTIGQAMAQYSTILATIFGNIAGAVGKFVDLIRSSGSSHIDVMSTVASILSAIGSVFSTIGSIIQKIPLLGPLIADGLAFMGEKLKLLPALVADAARQAAAGAAVAAAALARATQATVDAAVAAAKAVWDADYKKALATAVAATKAAAEAAAQGTINALKASLQAAQDAAAAAQKALAAALDKLKKFSLPPVGWNPKWPWPPDSWPPSVGWPPDISLPRPPGWPSLPECVWPPTQWPPAAKCLPAVPPPAPPPPPSCPAGLHVEGNACVWDPTPEPAGPPAQTIAEQGGIWHIILGAGAGLLLGGPPGAVAGGIAAANLLGGVKVAGGGQ